MWKQTLNYIAGILFIIMVIVGVFNLHLLVVKEVANNTVIKMVKKEALK